MLNVLFGFRKCIISLTQMNPFLKCEAVFHSGEEAGCELGYYKHQGEFSSDTTGEEV